MNISAYLILITIHCKSTETKIETASEKEVQVSQVKKELIQESDSVNYYELPDTTSIENPEGLLTFSLPVTNQIQIQHFRKLVTSASGKYSIHPPSGCLPSYNSALVFKKGSNKEIILFSYNCGLLYMSYEKLFIDVSESRSKIEESFRSIRSGK
ncbi:hypothetical protein [Leptospira sp. GIMC2001]|uniref:hypothetical protein n=1 Tax=Leptospira sp. GIMC2001 TaxID=1513297 RepID=UPI00234B5431|nr:hypothetical protein [Leptospira sp. GIMC2001]WCL49322.1 hypothetical protein O4O04_18840 [Leptospira sp. GIMC2001]